MRSRSKRSLFNFCSSTPISPFLCRTASYAFLKSSLNIPKPAARRFSSSENVRKSPSIASSSFTSFFVESAKARRRSAVPSPPSLNNSSSFASSTFKNALTWISSLSSSACFTISLASVTTGTSSAACSSPCDFVSKSSSCTSSRPSSFWRSARRFRSSFLFFLSSPKSTPLFGRFFSTSPSPCSSTRRSSSFFLTALSNS